MGAFYAVGDAVSSNQLTTGKIKLMEEIDTWREREEREWQQFKAGCPGGLGGRCYVMSLYTECCRSVCPLWYAVNKDKMRKEVVSPPPKRRVMKRTKEK